MENKDATSLRYSMKDAPYRYPSFSPIDFDVSGVLAGFQSNPIAKNSTSDNAWWGPIIRDYYVIYYAISGSGSIVIDNRKFAIEAPCIFISFPGTVVMEYTEKPNPWEYHYIHLKSSCLHSFLKILGISETQPIFKTKELPDLTPIFERLTELSVAYAPTAVLERVSLINELITSLINCSPIPNRADESKLSANEYIAHSLRYFEMNFRDASVNAVSNALGLTRSYFSTLFKAHMRLSPQEYLIRLKIQKACEFLMLPNSTISNVANSVGYDLFAFSRVFKKIMGISPSDYQKNNR